MQIRRKKLVFYLISVLCVFVVIFIVSEITLRLVSPTEYLHPRYKYSPEYGLTPFENVVMVHGVPGKFKFEYTINELGYRGTAVTPGGAGETPRIVVLGDSYAFGMGVNDGEEFPAVLDRTLGTTATVVNIASPGWGLTQQIRRFYDVGLSYQPAAVVLQFCANDPADNFVYGVTKIKDGEFVYSDSYNKYSFVKKYLSRSFIQRSQLYNFLRGKAYRMVEQKLINNKEKQFKKSEENAGGTPPQEALYRDLLDLFASKLGELNLPLFMISVDHQLDEFPWIKEKVQELEARSNFQYLEVTDWLEGMTDYHSVEGHVWGHKAHEVVGERLGVHIRRKILESAAPGPAADQ
jgi:hypothetical protein